MDIGLILDVAVVTILLFSVVIAVLRGFIREILTVLGLIGGAAAAYVLGPLLVGTTRGWLGVSDKPEEQQEQFFDILPMNLVADALAYGMVFVVFLIVLSVISYFLSKFVQSIGLGAVDRALGAVFGLARGALVVGLLFLIPHYVLSDEDKESYFENSKTYVYADAAAKFVDSYIPKTSDDEEEKGLEDVVKSAARKKMEELDILRGEKDETTPEGQSVPKKGYTDEFRDGMDQLIETLGDNVDIKPADQNLNE